MNELLDFLLKLSVQYREHKNRQVLHFYYSNLKHTHSIQYNTVLQHESLRTSSRCEWMHSILKQNNLLNYYCHESQQNHCRNT